MVIVQGVFRVDPSELDAYLAQSVEGMRASRAEKGCLEYVIAADPVEPGRVILSERWESMDDLNEHVRGLTRRRQEPPEPASAPAVNVASRQITMYEVASAQEMV